MCPGCGPTCSPGLRSHASGSRGHGDLAFFLPTLEGGGAERVMLNLAAGFAERGFQTDLILASAEGPYLSLVPTLRPRDRHEAFRACSGCCVP